MSGSAEEQGAEGAVGFRQALIVPQPAGHRASLPSLSDRQPSVPLSPVTGLATSLKVIEPAGQSTPVSLPTRCPTPVIKPNPHFSYQQSLEWDSLGERLVGRRSGEGSLLGIGQLESNFKKASATNPNLLDESDIALVSTDCSAREDSLEEVFEGAGNILVEKCLVKT